MNGPGAAEIQRTSRTAAVAVIGVLLLAHFVFRPWLKATPVAPDLLLAGLLLASLRLRAGPAAGLGFTLGFLEAAMALSNPGPYALVYTVAAYASARSRDLLFADARIYVALYLLAGTWLTRVSVLVLADTGPGMIGDMAWAALTAASTALFGLVAHALASPSMR